MVCKQQPFACQCQPRAGGLGKVGGSGYLRWGRGAASGMQSAAGGMRATRRPKWKKEAQQRTERGRVLIFSTSALCPLHARPHCGTSVRVASLLPD